MTSLDPETGREIWSVPYESTNGLVVMTPVLWQTTSFVGGYANKNMLVQLAADGQIRGNGLEGHSAARHFPDQCAADRSTATCSTASTRTAGSMESSSPTASGCGTRPRRWASGPSNSGTAFIIRQADRYWLFTENGDLIDRRSYARWIQRTRPRPCHRTDGRRIRPVGRLVLARLRQLPDVRPQR